MTNRRVVFAGATRLRERLRTMSDHSPEASDRPAGHSAPKAHSSPPPTSEHRESAHMSTGQVAVDVEVTTPSNPPSRERVVGSGIGWLALWSGRWILIAIAVYMLYQLLGMAWGILMPVALAMLVAAVLEPLSRGIERWLKFPPSLAAASTLLLLVGVVVWSVFLMAPSVASQSTDIADDAVKGIDEVQKWVQDSNLFNKEQIDEFLAAAQQRLTDSAAVIASGVLTGVGAVTSVLINMVVIAFLVFFFLKDGRKFLPWLQRSSGPAVGGHLVEVFSRAWSTLGGFIRTQALVSFIDAVLIGAGLLVIGVPLALPLAVLTFFGGFIPIVGAIAAGIVAVLVALVSNGLVGALWVLLLILAVQQIEGNLLSPVLQSKSMDLHPAIVLLSVTLGSGLYGIAGAFLAVPVAAVTAVIFRYLNEQVDLKVDEQGRAAATTLDGGPDDGPPTDPGDQHPSLLARARAALAAARRPSQQQA